MRSTYMQKQQSVERKWYVVDATDKVLGRVAVEIATVLRGKHKPTFTPHVDGGDYVIVINAEKVALTGKKFEDKMYYRHSGYAGGLKTRTANEMLEKQPQKIVELAVKGMLPKGVLGDNMYRRLYVYTGNEHPHAAQKPEALPTVK
ncbi:MAG: 50S ribosomal protein L13 [Bacilli bacterium]|nr:50S ribosomal protein L13 [Bacilli bacterium]